MSLCFRRTRLAPSPTGSLHLGHARTFLITWWLARNAGAEILFRMEDLDARRAKPESVARTYDDLRWLGIDWDAGPVQGAMGRCDDGEYIQSHRRPIYVAALDQLWRQRAIYPCVCSRAEIAASVAQSAGAPQEGDVQVRYPGTCRELWHSLAIDQAREQVAAAVQQKTGKSICWRFRVPLGTVSFDDALHGSQRWDVDADCGDFPVTRFDDTPAYQLAVAVDDAAMGVDCVIRGDDLLGSTPRQMLIDAALGYTVPHYVHVPLVVGLDGKRLAKRHGESRIAEFRAAGVSAERVVGWVAWRSGQIDRPQAMQARELVGRFELQRVPRTPVVMTGDDLRWLLGKHEA